MAFLKIYDRAGVGFDLSELEEGAFFDGPSRFEAELIDEARFDANTDILTFRDADADPNAREFSIFVRDDRGGGSTIESIFYFDERGRITLEMTGLEERVRDPEVRSFNPANGLFDALEKRDTVVGNRFADDLRGGPRADTLRGRDGSDRLYGGNGDDRLAGGRGADRLFGGDGGDVLAGGSGRDRLRGGADADVFVFGSRREAGNGDRRDAILDFDNRRDFIDLTGIDANIGRRGDQAFDFIGDRRFSGDAGELRFRNEVLRGDVDGDRETDFSLEVRGVETLRAVDILL